MDFQISRKFNEAPIIILVIGFVALKSILQFQLNSRIPKRFFKVHYFVVLHFNTFLFQKFLHEFRMTEVMFACELPVSVQHSVSRHIFLLRTCAIHRPSDNSCRFSRTNISGNCTVRGNSSLWHLPCNLVYNRKYVFC